MGSAANRDYSEVGPAKIMAQDRRALRYVMSAGRTGTVFLEQFLNHNILDITAAHEPHPSRYHMMLGNMRNDWGIGGGVLKTFFNVSRQKRQREASGIYVELNPFLCAIADLVPFPGRTLRVIHMVRDPVTWASSILSFKASASFRSAIDYIPFAKPYPSPRPDGWRHLPEYQRALWRWRWCNERIAGIRDACEAYAIVRYEDLFGEDSTAAKAAIDTICSTLDLPMPVRVDLEMKRKRLNPGPDSSINVDLKATARICGSLAAAYGYEY